jgi:hypothetical protein
MKALQTLFQAILFILSLLALGSIFYQLFTERYSQENFTAILIFMIPVLLSFLFSANLLINRK